ncbi:MAG: radical SAM protein [Clostridia bacterium]|nr:radical SAM protein [Clostridia bacterium]
MKFELEANTKVRFEKDGIYIMNSKYQTKEKITDTEGDGKIFYKAIHSEEIEEDDIVKGFLKKHFIVPLQSYEEIMEEKNSRYTSAPIYMTLGITSGCNYRCKHCGNNSTAPKESDLKDEEIYKLLDEMIELNLLKINFTGGEPTTNPHLIEYIRYVKGKIPRITMTTNGSLITDEFAKRLKDAGLNMAKISIDGLSMFHNQFRNFENAYEKAIAAIKNFQKHGIEVRVQTTLTKDNTKDLLDLMEVLSDLKISHQTIVPVCPIGRADREMMLDKESYKNFIYDMHLKVKDLIEKGTTTNFQIRPVFGARELFEGLKNTSFETLSMKYSCEALQNTMEIQPNGDIVPCSFLSLPIGNVRNKSLLEIWKDAEANKLRGLFENNKNNEHCSNCSKSELCNGGCIANKYYYHNDLTKKEPYCFVD